VTLANATRACRRPPTRNRKAQPMTGHGHTRVSRPAASYVAHLDAAKHSVKSWLDKATVTGGEVRGGAALKAYKRYAGRMAKDMKGSELQALLAEILGQGAVMQRPRFPIISGTLCPKV
jgi:hypothetical protein